MLKREKRLLINSILSFGVLLIFFAVFLSPAKAEFDAESYSYEELLAIREKIDERIEEIDREYAIAHADRAISFPETEIVLFVQERIQLNPTVERLKEDAPNRTTFQWESSDPEIAVVDGNGIVRVTGKGDAVITARAADNPYLTASCVIHGAVPVERVTVWGQSEPILIQEDPAEATAQIGYDIEPEDAYYQDVTWTSSNENVATVDENGIVQAVAPGQTEIRATSTEIQKNGTTAKSASLTIRIVQGVTGISLAESEMEMFVGQRGTITATVIPENAANRGISYESDNPEIAEVNANGTVIAKAAGKCTITCSTTDGSDLYANCQIEVKRLIETLKLSETELRMPIGGTHRIEAEIMPEDATNKEIVWTSSNVFVARVSDGMIEAVGQGDCDITCNTLDGSDLSATIHVRVPTFSTEETEYTVTDKQGLIIPLILNRKGSTITISEGNEYFTSALDEEQRIHVIPLAAGSGELQIENPEAPEDSMSLHIVIEDSAVFNSVSYPQIAYMDIMKQPEEYEGRQMSIHGKILQTEDDGETITLFVGTAGKAYTDQVFQVQTERDLMPPGQEAEEAEATDGKMVTIYGVFRMAGSYSEALQTETMVPTLDAERITEEQK